jgi:signal transduction histidine kinase
MLKKKTIFSRMFLSYSLLIILSLLLFIAVFFYLFHINLYKEYEEIYEHHYVQLENQLQNQRIFGWTDNETAEILSYSLEQSGYRIYFFDKNGKQILGPEANQGAMIPSEVLDEVEASGTMSEGGFKDGELQYTIASKLNTSINGLNQPIMVMIFHELSHEYQRVIWMILLTFLIAILFAGIILWFMSKRITAPLREMSRIARDYAKGDFSKSVNYELNDEIGQLAKSFTYMANELNDLERARRQYISNVSHELRSPLTSIKGFVIAFLDRTIPNERHEYYYRLMKEETERMIKLVNDTLDMNQLEEGQPNLLKTNYNLTKQIKTIIHKLEPQLSVKQVHIRFDANQDYDVFADKERIEQVLMNLIHNAIQFSDSEAVVDVSLSKEGQDVNVRIQDYGIGMEEEQLELIWRRFYKADESRSSKSGAGLGLAIVKSILDLHEAEVKVESEPNEGTIFSFKLPLS